MNWYYAKNGIQHGPLPLDALRNKIAAGEVLSNDLVWREGMANWMPASEVTELQQPALPPSSPYQTPSSLPDTSAEIPNYLWQAIVVTVLCCWPLGIPAIVYAAKVDGLKARGDIAGAIAASSSAKKWATIALVGGLAVVVIYILIAIVGASA